MTEGRFEQISRTVKTTKDIVHVAQTGKKVLVIVKDGPGLAKMKTGLIALGIDQANLENVVRINARGNAGVLLGHVFDHVFIEPTAYETYPFSVARMLLSVEAHVLEREEP